MKKQAQIQVLAVIPAGVVHDAHNGSKAPIKLVGVYVVEKRKPLTSPAP